MKSLSLLLILLSTPLHAREVRRVIALVDTGINSRTTNRARCSGLDRDFTGGGLKDVNGHGSNLADIIMDRIDPRTTCVAVIKVAHAGTGYAFITGLEYALNIGARFVNFSFGGPVSYDSEIWIIHRLLESGASVSVAAGNENEYLNESSHCSYFPACYHFNHPRFYVVGSTTRQGKKSYFSNYGPKVTSWALGENLPGGGYTMSGTSQATALWTSILANRATR